MYSGDPNTRTNNPKTGPAFGILMADPFPCAYGECNLITVDRKDWYSYAFGIQIPWVKIVETCDLPEAEV